MYFKVLALKQPSRMAVVCISGREKVPGGRQGISWPGSVETEGGTTETRHSGETKLGPRETRSAPQRVTSLRGNGGL
ncbi:MAG: hypothetical protein KDC10_09475, partial [Calditrichaeota bacterium]|nr:hypothetical protein [Calditrichota bacterium]